jgi:hypothetical protein
MKYDLKIKSVLDEMLLDEPKIRLGKMFGFPAHYSDKKLCICLYEQGMGIKLPADVVNRLLQEDNNVIRFQPFGRRVMREWVQINLPAVQDYRKYWSIFMHPVEYAQMMQNK